MLKYEELPEKIKTYYHRNITMSVAFVKKDGTVRHMSFRRNLASYVKSDAEKTEKQANVLQNNNLFKVYDTNVYIKALKEFGDPSKAASMSFRHFKLENVLAFMCGGSVFDMRQQNYIKDRFGEEVAEQLTPNMIQAMKRDENDAQQLDNVMENKNYSILNFIKEEIKKLHKKTLLENRKAEIENELKLLKEYNNYDYPLGADADTNAPWHEKLPEPAKFASKHIVDVLILYPSDNLAILQDKEGAKYIFEFGGISRDDLGQFSSNGQDEIDEEGVEGYVNEYWGTLSKGKGLNDYQSGNFQIILIDDETKVELIGTFGEKMAAVLSK